MIKFENWAKSSFSPDTRPQCVEVAHTPNAVGVRDTKNRERGHLAVTRSTWTAFVRSIAS